MKFSENWLREWVSPAIGSKQLAEQLTMAGLEVDAVEPVAGGFKGVIVAQVLEVQPHPEADKLSICTVKDGAQQLQVVCGAANVRAGLKVALARVGTVLSDNFTIKAAKLRGVESQGMLCSESELGLSEVNDGIMELAEDAPLGTDLRQYLNLDDSIIDIDLTPNRGDCLSIAGLAREIGTLNQLAVNRPDLTAVAAVCQDSFAVRVLAPADCPRYAGRVIKNIDIAAPTPLWMQEKLRRAGVRSIDAVVDTTNYVMLELGQPMHAFDLERLNQRIEVRRAAQEETLTLLDGKEVKLDEGSLIIADAAGPLALAGIMGGENSGVAATTRHIFLESAFFSPMAVAGRARSFGLHTDSSHRFERGVDYGLQLTAIERATRLLLDIVGGEPGPVTQVVSEPHLPRVEPILLRRNRIAECLQLALDDTRVEAILGRLGLELSEVEQGWLVRPPSYRFDISIEEDLLEELARVYGYNLLPVSLPASIKPPKFVPESRVPLTGLRRVLLDAGYSEAITYSFVDPSLQRQFAGEEGGIALANPISSDMAVMRKSLWPGLVQALRHNLNRQQARVRLFETGLVFRNTDQGIEQQAKIGGLIAGTRQAESWFTTGEPVDFYDIKGQVQALLSLGGRLADFAFQPGRHPALHPGKSAQILDRGKPVGLLGALHPALEKELDISLPVMLFELDLEAISEGVISQFAELSKFPEVRRDLAILVDESVPLAAVKACVERHAGEALREVKLFDLYRGQGIEPGRKSLALGLTWQHRSRTLTEADISQLVDCIINNLEKEFSAVLRG